MTNGVQGHENGFAGAMVHSPQAGPSIVKAQAPDESRAFEPRGIAEAVQLAKLLVASRLLPKSVTTPESAFAIIATGRELGLTAMQSLRSIHIIEGKPTLSADLVAALVKSRRDICQWFRLVESTDQVATYETHRVGEPSPTRMSFTISDANRAGVTGKDNWRKYPAAMLRARCITALARAVYPDLAMGVYDPDEMAPEAPPTPAVIHTPSAIEQPVVADLALFANICDRIDAAENAATLNGIARDAQKAHRYGKLGDEHLETIKVGVQKKRALLGQLPTQPAPPEPPSAPGSGDLDGEGGES